MKKVTLQRLRAWIARRLPQPSHGLVPAQSERAQALFDARWYVFKYPDITSEVGAFAHYMMHGWRELRWPHPLFDPEFYLAPLNGETRAVINPLVHYLAGEEPERSPHPMFDIRWYRRSYMGAADSEERVLEHFDRQADASILNPSAWFDTRWYLGQHPDITDLGWTAAAHYAHFGWKTGARPHEAFDSEWYTQTYLADLNIDPLSHYLTAGLTTNHRPKEDFEEDVYLSLNPDVKSAGIAASQHYFEAGFAEKREYKFAANKYVYTSFGLLTQAIHSAGASVDGHSLSLRLPLRHARGAHPYRVQYRGQRSTVDMIDRLVDVDPEVLNLPDSYAIGGTRYVVDRDGHLLNFEESRYFDDPNVGVKWGHAARSSDHQMQLRVKTRAAQFLDAGINLMHEHSENYFHFVAETLPRMMLAEEADLPPHIPFVFERGLHPNFIELVNASNSAGRPIVWLDPGVLVYFGTMYYPRDVSRIPNAYGGGAATQETAIDVERVRRATERCKSLVKLPPIQSAGVYVSRRGKVRNIVNEEKLEEVLRREGLNIAQVETLSITEQIALFSSSPLFISPTGAQLTNIVWCRPGTSLNYLVADHPHMQLHLWGLLGKVSGTAVSWTKGPRDHRITGEYSVHDDFYIDEHQLAGWVREHGVRKKAHNEVA